MNRAAGISINLYFSERSWNGLVIADASSQNAKVLSAPKPRLEELLSREELQRSGIYILMGPNSEDAFGLEGYIGESDKLATRLRGHAKRNPFWSRVYVAVSKDSWFSKSHIRFLEARLMMYAKNAPLITKIRNKNKDISYDRLSEGDEANLEGFIDSLALVMPSIGCPLFNFPDSIHTGAGSIEQPSVSISMGEEANFELVKGVARGVAYLKDGAFWVRKGSTARLDEYSSLRDGYRKTRKSLMDRRILITDNQRGVLVFTQDVPFNSPSDAAAVIGTTSLNGRKEWKIIGNGMTYAEWEMSSSRKS